MNKKLILILKSTTVMCVFQISDVGLSEDEMREEKKKLTDYTATFEKELKIDSLQIQVYNGIGNFAGDAPTEVLRGESHVHEKLFDLDFRISPSEYLQLALQRFFFMRVVVLEKFLKISIYFSETDLS